MRVRAPGSRFTAAVLVVLTAACTWLTVAKLSVSGNMASLLPSSGSAAALTRWTRAFGGRDMSIVLVTGEAPEAVAAAAQAVAEGLRASPSFARVLDRAPPVAPPSDPTLVWALAGPTARARLADAMTQSGMRARLEGTRAILLAPSVDPDLEAWVARDPLRLAQLPFEGRAEVAGSVAASPGDPFVTADGRARLVVAEPRGSAFVSDDARAVVFDAEQAIARASRPGVRFELAGGHAIASATEQMLKRDLAVSGTLSMALASLAFVLTFRRVRALAAVLPPLVLGTVWTTGLAAALPAGLSAVAIAFAAVVVGVGVDTGIHVYAALLGARRRGLTGAAAARAARAATWWPTLTAAAVAAVAFAALGLSGLRAMKQLGLLCGAGELLTAVAILLTTPELGALLERGIPPRVARPPWVLAVRRLTSSRSRAVWALAVSALPLGALALWGWPVSADALVAIRPKALAPLVAEDHVRALFGGRTGQWIVLSEGATDEEARVRADAVAEALDLASSHGDIDGFDALTTWAPAAATQRARLMERDRLDLPLRSAWLEHWLCDAGFRVASFATALDAFAHPAEQTIPDPTRPDDPRAFLFARHIGRDAGQTLVATYVRPLGDPVRDARARQAIQRADPHAAITGFGDIDVSLRETLARDLGVVGAVALAIVAIAMRLALRSARHALVALTTLACEMGIVGVAMRVLGVRWHVYDALVLPVLFGVTIDEAMFLLHAARETSMDEALESQGPLVAATALTTAAGFAALLACRFDGLRDLGAVGAIGVLAGLGAALVVVPAALRLSTPGRIASADVARPSPGV